MTTTKKLVIAVIALSLALVCSAAALRRFFLSPSRVSPLSPRRVCRVFSLVNVASFSLASFVSLTPERRPMKIFPKNEKSAFRAVDADVKRRIIGKRSGRRSFERFPVCLRSTFHDDRKGGRVAEWQTLGI